MAKTSSLAANFSLFGQNIKRQTQMAYQQAAQEIQQTQASQLAQRQMLVQMLKGEQDYLRSLRKDLRDLNKNLDDTSISNTDKYKLYNALSQVGNVYANISKEDLDTLKREEDKLDKKFNIDPSLEVKIKAWQRSIDGKATQTEFANKNTFNNFFGFDTNASNNKAWQDVVTAFAKLDNPDSKSVGREAISNILERYGENNRITNVGNERYLATSNEALTSALNHSGRLTLDEARTKKEKLFEDAKKKLGTRADVAFRAYKQFKSLDKQIKDLSDKNPNVQQRIQNIKSNIDDLGDEINESKKLIKGYRDSLSKPADKLPTIRQRAGELLLEQDQIKAFAKQQKKAIRENVLGKMDSALAKQSPEDEQLLKYIAQAKTFKSPDAQVSNASNKFFDAWTKGLQTNTEDPGTIKSYFKKVDSQSSLNKKHKDVYKAEAVQRLLKAVEETKKTQTAFKEVSQVKKPKPTPKVEPKQPKQFKEYTVKSGDSLSKIASDLKVNMKDLMKINNITNPDKIKVGQKIKWQN